MTQKKKKRPPTKGGFQKGNKAAKGKGRPPKVAELREAEMLRDVFDKKRLHKILNVIYSLALQGDTYCLKFIAERFFPAEFMADKLAGEETNSLNLILAELKAEYRESDG